MENNWCHYHSALCFSTYRRTGMTDNCTREEPLAQWERELLAGHAGQEDGIGNVTFYLSNGDSFTIDNVRVDSISPNGANNGVIAAEGSDGDTIYHVPWVSYWTVDYPF